MSRVIDLRTAIQDFLESVHPRVYHKGAPKERTYPYLVHNLPSSFDDGELETFVLEVDGWDSPADGDTTALETLMASVDGDGDLDNPTGLHRRTLNLEGLTATIFRDSRLSPDDPDERIIRRTYTYQVKVLH